MLRLCQLPALIGSLARVGVGLAVTGGRGRWSRIWRTLLSGLVLTASAEALLALPARAVVSSGERGPASGPALQVVPFPGTPDASPRSEVIFSSLSRPQLRSVIVSGSRSGRHAGRLIALPDGAGTAFVLDRPFTAPEIVRVTAALTSAGAGTATGDPGARVVRFSFGVLAPVKGPAGPGATGVGQPAATTARRAPVQRYHSQPGLHPPLIRATSDPDRRSGDIFLTPANSRQHGPMILNSQGQLVWFHYVPGREVFNLEVHRYRGKPVLTWWQGKLVDGHGASGTDVIMNSSYQQVAALHAGNGYAADEHEFQVTPQGRALIDAYVPVHANLSSVGGPSSGTVLDCVIQELDVKTGRVLWEWHALGHVPLSASYASPGGSTYDYFHLNSIEQLPGGRLLVSARNTWSVYMINEHTGRIEWTLGGKESNFRVAPGANFEWQHDAVLHRNGLLTLFDDAAVPEEEAESSAKELRVNARTHTVSLVARFTHSPPLLTGAEGSVELLKNHDVFVGWGSTPQFSEYTPSGHQIFNGSFLAPVNSYRAYRFAWAGHPRTRGALAVSPGPNGAVTVYASWNGATNVAAWRVLGGNSPKALAPLGNAKRQGFETAIHVHSEPPYFAVQALDGRGHVLRESAPVRTPAHADVYGRHAFVSASSGRGALPVACFTVSSKSCSVGATISSGGHRLSQTPHRRLASGRGALLRFSLSAAGRRQLRQSGAKGLPVNVSVRSASGTRASLHLSLFPFSTSGPGPKRSVMGSSRVQLVTTTDFVSRAGQGAILAGCYGAAPCLITTTVSSAGVPIATARSQTLGADELGYLNVQLNAAGRTMLSHASGNQLAAQVRLSSGQGAATGQIALVRYG